MIEYGMLSKTNQDRIAELEQQLAELLDVSIRIWMPLPDPPSNAGIHRAAEGRPVE